MALPFLAWFKNFDLARLIDAAVAVVAKFFTGLSSPPARTQTGQPQTSASNPAPGPVDDEAAAKTVLVNRVSFGSIAFVSGSLVGQRKEIPPQGLTIGRNPKSDVVLTDEHVSRDHALIRPKDGRVIIVDRGSGNGVFLNKVENKVEGEAPLENGDLVMLSSSAEAVQFIYRS